MEHTQTYPAIKRRAIKILQIGNYPPPFCGWSVQTKLLVEEIRKRGHVCDVLNLNENRKTKSSEYIDVQNGFDYVQKLVRFAIKCYHFQVHVNGQSWQGYVLALVAALAGRLAGRPIALSWRGGLQQRFFPRPEACLSRWAFQLLFRLSGQIACNNVAVKEAIVQYGIGPARVVAIPGFSSQHLSYTRVSLSGPIEQFLRRRHPAFFCYVSFRPEYKLPVLRDAMSKLRERYPLAGFIWLGFPANEVSAAMRYVESWTPSEKESLLLLGNLPHDEFLTLLDRTSAYVRTPACDGVSASVLESLALGVPVLASENGHRPAGVVTYREGDAADLSARLVEIAERGKPTRPEHWSPVAAADNIANTADWLLENVIKQKPVYEEKLAHV